MLESEWHAQYVEERGRLLSALGRVTEGGLIEGIEHIGSTSVPGMKGRACVDILLAVWPYPPPPAQVAALGYALVPEYEMPPEQRWRSAGDRFQLHVVEAGSDEWTNALLLRDYWRAVPAARQAAADKRRFAAVVEGEAFDDVEAKAVLFRSALGAASQWCVHERAFAPLTAPVNELSGFSRGWWISSGWALDLYLDRVTRVHHDIDIIINRADQLELREHMTSRGWTFMTPFQGRREPWRPHTRLELPRHQAHAYRGDDYIDFLLADIDAGVWRYRRDPRVVRPLAALTRRSGDGIPYLGPEAVLLFKSKNTSNRARPQDAEDFTRVSGALDREQRAWLRWALEVSDPGHAWIEALG